MKTILITGGAGFIGTNVALEAFGRGYEVIVLDSLRRHGTEDNVDALETLGIKVIRCDVTDRSSLPVFDRLDCIIHLASQVGVQVSINNPTFDFNQNAIGTINMLEMARVYKAVFLYASTNKVYGSTVNEIPIREGKDRYEWNIDGITELMSVGSAHHTPYGVSKLVGDLYTQEYYQTYGLKTVVNRMSCIYGEYQNGAEEQGWIDHAIRSNLFAQGEFNIYGDGKQVRDVLWGGDVAKLYVDEFENIDKCAGEVFNIGGGKENTLSLKECLGIIEEETGISFTPKILPWRDADQKIYISDISKVKKLLGWSPTVGPLAGIRKMVNAYKGFDLEI